MRLLAHRGVLVKAEGAINERVQTNAAGQVMLKLKTAWRDGTPHLVISPLEFMERLAALVPRTGLGHGK